jgi:hypothetical protein
MIIRPIKPATTTTAQPKSVPGRGAAIADIWIKDRWNDWSLDVKQALFDMEKEKATDKAKRDYYTKQIDALYEERRKLQELDAKDTMNWRDNMTTIERQKIQSGTQASIAVMEEKGRMERSRAELTSREKIEGIKAEEKAGKAVRDLKPAEAYIPAIKGALKKTTTAEQLNALIGYEAGPSGDVLLNETGVPLLQESYIKYQRNALDSINADPRFDVLSPEEKILAANNRAVATMERDLDPNVPKQAELFNKFKNTLDPTTSAIKATQRVGAGVGERQEVRPVYSPRAGMPQTAGVGAAPTARDLAQINADIKKLQEDYEKIPELAPRSIRERARETYGTQILGKAPAQARQAEVLARLQSMSPEQINNILQMQQVRTALGEDMQFTPEQIEQAEAFGEAARLDEDAAKEMPALSVQEAQKIAREADKEPAAYESEQGKTLAEMARKRLAGMTEQERAEADAAFFAQKEAEEAQRAPIKPRITPRPAPSPAAVEPAETYTYPFERPSFFNIPPRAESAVPEEYTQKVAPPVAAPRQQPAAAVPTQQPAAAVPRQQASIDAQRTVAGDVYGRVATEYDSPIQTAKRTVQQLAGQEAEPRPGTQPKPVPVPPAMAAYQRAVLKSNPTIDDVRPILKDTTQDKKQKDAQLLGLALGKAKTVISNNTFKEIKQYFVAKEAKEVLDLFNKYLERGTITQDEMMTIYKDTVLGKPSGDAYWNALMAYTILAEAKNVGWDMKVLQEQSDL